MTATEWEDVASSTYRSLQRIEVPGGYLYRSTQWSPVNSQRTESMEFVPCELKNQQELAPQAPDCSGCAGTGGRPCATCNRGNDTLDFSEGWDCAGDLAACDDALHRACGGSGIGTEEA